MKSLKTDDILGARPRIRHAPKSLLRPNDQRSSLQNSGQLYRNPYPQHEFAGYTNKNNIDYNIINHNPNPNDKYNPVKKQLFSLYQKAATQPNPQHSKTSAQPATYPKVSSRGKNASQNINNSQNLVQPSYLRQVNLSQSFHQQSPFIDKSQSLVQAVQKDNKQKTSQFIFEDNANTNTQNNSNSRIRREQRISKQAPFTNYEPFLKNRYNKDTTYTRTYNEQSKQLYKQYEKEMSEMKINNNQAANGGNRNQSKTQRQYKQLIQESKQIRQANSRPASQKKRSLSSVSNQVQSNRAQRYEEQGRQGEQQSKSLFRGLGYNIVSNNNNRNSYDLQKMESKYINRISRLIQ